VRDESGAPRVPIAGLVCDVRSLQSQQRDGVRPALRSWQDRVSVPPKGRVRIAWLPDDRPGYWMYHCHILEHHAGGMMANFLVVRAGESVANPPSAHSYHS
jgi:FtsP/CotA-like multicopper oxidase with cupredoxin domain